MHLRHLSRILRPAVVASVLLGPPGPCPAESLRLDVTADTSIVLVEKEAKEIHGARPSIRIKGNQHIVALAFDAQPMRGKVARAARLLAAKGDASIEGVTISTIEAPWDEAAACAVTSGRQPHEGWAWPGAWFPAVCGGNSGSLVCHAPSVVSNGWYVWEVDPDLINACAIGAAWGLAIHEFSADYSRNPTVFARERPGRAPYLLVETGPPDPAPGPPSHVETRGALDSDGLRIHLSAPRTGFAYEVCATGGQAVPRWNIPFVRPGQHQVIPLRDLNLPDGAPSEIEIVTLDRSGRRSPPATLRVTMPARRTFTPPEPLPLPSPAPASAPGIAALPVSDRYDSEGRPIGELPDDYLQRNEVFDGRAIRLTTAAGEVAAFQILVRGTGTVTAACAIPGLRVELSRALYVEANGRRVPDPLVPAGEIALSPDTAAPVVADVFVPFDAAAREHSGEFRLSDGRVLPVTVRVLPIALPRRASFAVELNSYGMPDAVAEYLALQRAAVDHRAHVNIVHYGHHSAAAGSRKCGLDLRFDEGRRMDEARYNAIPPGSETAWWDDFVAAFGPWLSGEAVAAGHRGPIPAPAFYTTFHESWPLHLREFFNGNPDACEAFRDRPEYARTFTGVLRDFLALVRRRAWTDCGLIVYLNNKGALDDPRRAPWVLDEPSSWHDYRALAYYADLVRQARSGSGVSNLWYRIDISRPEFDRGLLEGKADLWVVGQSAFRRYERLLRDRRERTGEHLWIYGSPPPAEVSARQAAAWLIDSWVRGAEGAVPWQTLHRGADALRKSDPLGLLILENPGGPGAPQVRATMRLKAWREGQQTIEYLALLRDRLGLSRNELEDIVRRCLPPDSGIQRSGDADAGLARYDRLDPAAFRRLRHAALALAP